MIALSGPPPVAAFDRGVEALRAAGFEPVLAGNTRRRESYLAGDDNERVAGLLELLASGVEALIAARGGYGIMRVLPVLPWERLADWGGWVIGFSDVTALHAALSRRSHAATVHGPMVTSLPRHRRSAERAFALLGGRSDRLLFSIGPRHVLRGGKVSGIGIGGNLSLLASLVGTPFEPDYDGAVLFLEDVGEASYRLDRLLTQLALSSRLAQVQAIVVGQMTRCGRGEAGWRDGFRRRLVEVAPPEAVVLEGLPFGHAVVNTPFPLGVEVTVDSAKGQIVWGGA